MKTTFGIVVILGFIMSFFGFQGLLSFAHSAQSKQDVKVVAVGTEKMPKYSLVKIWVVESNSTDTLVFTQNNPVNVGDTVSIWNVAEMWITPLWLRSEQVAPPNREIFTGWFRHDVGLGTFFSLMGIFLIVVGLLSIIKLKS